MRIGVDLMGSDSAPKELFQAVLQAAECVNTSCSFVVFATESVIEELTPLLNHSKTPSSQIEFLKISEVITPDDAPLTAVRHKKDSSIVVGIQLVKEGNIDAFVSTGNTGALVASATMTLPLLPGIHRTALLTALPTQNGSVAVLDVGGNVSCKAEQLVQFAHMGVAYQTCKQGIVSPRVGLLNIGVESMKGPSELRLAYQMLKQASDNEPGMEFIGNVEGLDVFKGKVDVLVTDGFTGNVFLKTSEGVSAFIMSYLRDAEGMSNKQAILDDLQKQINYDEYPGAIVCGVDGLVIKCHGYSSTLGMLNSIKGAIHFTQKKLVSKIKHQLIAAQTNGSS